MAPRADFCAYGSTVTTRADEQVGQSFHVSGTEPEPGDLRRAESAHEVGEQALSLPPPGNGGRTGSPSTGQLFAEEVELVGAGESLIDRGERHLAGVQRPAQRLGVLHHRAGVLRTEALELE